MQINLNVKIKAGPRTPASVDVYLTSANPKALRLINGNSIKDTTIAEWIATELQKQLKRLESEAKWLNRIKAD